ncbi:MAG: hypothetical protein ABIF09_05605, partial [Gemmatimonadota bacterium]
ACAGLPRGAGGQERDAYLSLAGQAFQGGLTSIPASVEQWKASFQPTPEWGYTPPGGPPYFARLAGLLYRQSGDESYAREAIQWLAVHHEYLDLFPEEMRHFRPDYVDGVPPLTNFFEFGYFVDGYRLVKDSPSMTPAQRQAIETSIAQSANYVFKFPEWGAMNRAMLRAYALELATQAVPDHPDAPRWKKMSRVLAADSWGKWEEEDAQIYHPVWLITLLRYADALGDPSYYQFPTVRYYFDYFTHLLDPTGNVPDFGDARWHNNWSWYVAILERGAKEYDRPDYRWAARRIFEAMGPKEGAAVGVGDGMNLLDAYLWSSDGPVEAPPAVSEEVMEDLVGKKIVFRDGWEEEANYLLLNYRDEGPYALMARNYLRHTIPVEEEKMHHGHSDENAIDLLMSGGSVLLNDAGYRPEMPSGPNGENRADYFHNRLVWRTGKLGREQPLWEFLRNSGGHETVETQKIDFWRGDGFDVSRTRATDERAGVQYDRVITWLKEPNLYVVFDIVKFLQTGYFTLANLWHATTILDQGDGFFVTAVDQVAGQPQRQGTALRIDMPQGGIRKEGTFPIKRNNEDNTALYEALASHYLEGQVESFVTVLSPVPREGSHASPAATIRVIETPEERAGIGVMLEVGGEEIWVAAKTDLDYGILAANKRPRYTFESGKVTYGPFATDADFFLARLRGGRLEWAGTNLVGVRYQAREIFAAPWSTFTLEPDDWATGVGAPKWRFWSDVVEVGR